MGVSRLDQTSGVVLVKYVVNVASIVLQIGKSRTVGDAKDYGWMQIVPESSVGRVNRLFGHRDNPVWERRWLFGEYCLLQGSIGWNGGCQSEIIAKSLPLPNCIVCAQYGKKLEPLFRSNRGRMSSIFQAKEQSNMPPVFIKNERAIDS